MDPAFWTGFFALAVAVVTAIGTIIKNYQQDKAALKRDFRINTLEAQHAACEEERVRLIEQFNTLVALKVSGKEAPQN